MYCKKKYQIKLKTQIKTFKWKRFKAQGGTLFDIMASRNLGAYIDISDVFVRAHAEAYAWLYVDIVYLRATFSV